MLGSYREAVGGYGFGNFRAAHYHWDRFGRPYKHTCTVHVHVHLCMLGRAREAMGGHGLGNFWAGDYLCDRLGRPHVHTCTVHVHVHLCMLGRAREAMDLVTFELEITTGTGSGGHTCTHALYMFTCTYAC